MEVRNRVSRDRPKTSSGEGAARKDPPSKEKSKNSVEKAVLRGPQPLESEIHTLQTMPSTPTVKVSAQKAVRNMAPSPLQRSLLPQQPDDPQPVGAMGQPIDKNASVDGDSEDGDLKLGAMMINPPAKLSGDRNSNEIGLINLVEDENKKLARLKKKVAKKAERQKASLVCKKKSETTPNPKKTLDVIRPVPVPVVKKKPSRAPSKTEIPQQPKKKKLGEKIKDTFRAFSAIFDKNRTQKSGQGSASKTVCDGDDVMPMTMKIKTPESDDEDDVWIDDPNVLTNRDHRQDLKLVRNTENNGQLFHEGKRPFWKNKMWSKEVPPPPAEKAVSKLLVQVVSGDIPLADPLEEPEPDYLDDLNALMAKDEKWFKEENILGNTIRSIVGSTDTQTMVYRNTGVPLIKLQIEEPAVTRYYTRHKLVITKEVPFKKSAPGKPTKLKARKKNSGVEGSPSPTASSPSA